MPRSRKLFYRRNLPHWQPPETTFFISYRLAGSLPVQVVTEMKEDYWKEKNKFENRSPLIQEKLREEYFYLFDKALDNNVNEPYWLKEDTIALVIWDSLFFNNNIQYIIWAGCIMPNHVHFLLSTLKNSPSLDVILQNHKKFTAVHCNKLLKRSGQFWQAESYDRIIRNSQYFNSTIDYILENPVNAGLIKDWKNWKWTYLHPQLTIGFNTT
ncbi:MAG: transposase [Chitinophagaceae bacterium]